MYMRMQRYIDNHLNAGPKKKNKNTLQDQKKEVERSIIVRLWLSTKASRVKSKRKRKKEERKLDEDEMDKYERNGSSTKPKKKTTEDRYYGTFL